MFNLFKRSKVADWEIAMLSSIFTQLGHKFNAPVFLNQLHAGMIKGVLWDVTDIPGYVCLKHNATAANFEKKLEPSYHLTGIRVRDLKSGNYLTCTLYFYSGLIIGYAITGAKKFNLDISSIDVSTTLKELTPNPDYDKISILLNEEEKGLINLSNVYELELEGKLYYNLHDLEDGDFVGIDIHKNVYIFTHDPYEITPSGKDLKTTLSEYVNL